MRVCLRFAVALGVVAWMAVSASADPVLFSTGDANDAMAMASRPETAGKIEIESADDFALGSAAKITGATFTGILTGNATPSDITQVVVELYRIFPVDSDTTRTPVVPTRANSPSDIAFASRDSGASTLSFSTSTGGSFTALNSVINGINTSAPFNTGGEGTQTGTLVTFTVSFSTPFLVGALEHDFFVPQVAVSGSENFLWLSGSRPIVAPGTPFPPGVTDLQAWIRNANLDPDWLRVGTDIVGGTTAPRFNGAFSLTGQAVPEPSSLALLGAGMLGVVAYVSRRRRTA